MKRKIFLTLLITLALVSIFAFSVSAEAYDETRTTIDYTDINGTTHEVPVFKANTTPSNVASVLGNNATMQALFEDNGAYAILADSKGELTAFPSWYIIEPKDQNVNYVAISEIEYDFVNTLIEGKTYSKGAIRYIEFPHGMTEVRANSVFGGSDTMYETNVTEIHIPSTVSSIGKGAFENKNNKSQLKYVYVEAGNTISKIEGSTFSNTKVEYFQFENLTELEEIDGFSNSALACDIDLSNSKLKTIWAGAFSDSTGIKKISLPDTVESIGDRAFQSIGSGYLASPYLPKSLTYVGERFFAYNDNLLETYIFPVGVKALADEPFQDSKVAGGPSGKELNLIFLGEVTGTVYLNGGGHQKHAEKVTVYFAQNSRSQYNTNGFKIKPSTSSVLSVPDAIRVAFCKGTGSGTNGSVTGVEYMYITNIDGTTYTADMVNDATNGFDFENHTHYGAKLYREETCGVDGFDGVNCIICDLEKGEIIKATGNHTTEDDGNCETEVICSVCQNVVIEAISHVIGEVYSYDKGYLETGTFKIGCTNKGCNHGETTEIPALAISKGFSQEIGENTGAIVFGITFNREAIEAYEKYLNTTIDFGLIVSSVQDESPLNSDASAKTGTIKNSFAEANYSIFQIKLIGIEKAQYAQLFHCGGYFLVDGEISYVNNKSIGSTSTLVSYNIVTTLVEKKD